MEMMRSNTSQKERAEEMCAQYKEKSLFLEEQWTNCQRELKTTSDQAQRLQQDVRSYRSKLKIKNEVLLRQEKAVEQGLAATTRLQQQLKL